MFLRKKERSGYISGVMSVEFQAYLQKWDQVQIMSNIMNIYSPTLILLMIFFKLPAWQSLKKKAVLPELWKVFLPLSNLAWCTRKQIRLIKTEARLTRKTAVAAKWLKAEKVGKQHVGLMMGGFQVSEYIKAFSLFIKLLWQHLTAKVLCVIRVQWT